MCKNIYFKFGLVICYNIFFYFLVKIFKLFVSLEERVYCVCSNILVVYYQVNMLCLCYVNIYNFIVIFFIILRKNILEDSEKDYEESKCV